MCEVNFCKTHGQNKTCGIDTEDFAPVSSLCGVVGSIWWFIKGLIGKSSELVDLCPNLCCNNSRENIFSGGFSFDFSFIFTKSLYFLCAICGNITAFCWLSLKKTVQNTLWKRQVCPNFISIIMKISSITSLEQILHHIM